MTTTAPASSISDSLRAATTREHRDAERRGFITDLMGGSLSLGDYTRYLAQLAYVYQALESRQPQADDPDFLSGPVLPRFSSIVADLEALGIDADEWQVAHPPLPETLAYVRQIQSTLSQPYPRYLAHHYTRYLGDLSGGQAIAAMVKRHYQAQDSQLNFYTFRGIDKPVEYKRHYRSSLDNLQMNEAELADLIDEAQQAYSLNAALFDALARP